MTKPKALLAVAAAILLFIFTGPRASVSTDAHKMVPGLPAATADVDAWLADNESKYRDIVPGTEKTLVWAGSPGERTDLALVYLHGWSASRQETRPYPDRVAERLGANLYYTRLTGHGRTPEAMGSVTLDDLAADAREAIGIGRLIGRRVILIGTSTGATLALWITAELDGLDSDPAALVLISPNFGPRDSRAGIMLWPWGRHLLRLVEGETRSFVPRNEMQARYWTTTYPTRALVPMMALVKATRQADLEAVTVPTLVFYSPMDAVIDAGLIPPETGRLAGVLEMERIEGTDDSSNHVLAGDILSPHRTDDLVERTVAFLEREL